MKSILILLGVIALTEALILDPIPNKALGGARKYKDSEKDLELGTTMDSLQQAEKELGMKLDAPAKLTKTKYEGIGANTALANQNAKDEQEDEDNTLASIKEAQKEADTVTAAEDATKKAELEK